MMSARTRLCVFSILSTMNYHQKLHMKASALRAQKEMLIQLSHLQRCADPPPADCEPPPLHQRRSRGEKCCWERACWNSRCWREPEGWRFMRQDRGGGRYKTNLIKAVKSFKSIFLCELHSTDGTICSTRCAAFKIR